MIYIYNKYGDLRKTIDTLPSNPVYIGKRRVENIKIMNTIYDEDEYHRQEIHDMKDINFIEDDKVQWIEVIGLHDEDLICQIGESLGLHQLTIEDILNMSQSPKLEEYGEYIFLITKNIFFNEDQELETEQIAFILKDNTLISFKETDGIVFENLNRRLKEGASIRRFGSDILLYGLLDTIVDDYFLIIGEISEEIDVVEDELLSDPNRELLQAIYELKRNLVYMRKILWAMRNVISNLSKNDYDDIGDKTIYYFRDVYDHIIQMIDIVETYRDICSGMLDIYLSSIGNKTNDVMKVLTIFSTISVPLTFLTGVYGMNFAYQPELQWKFAYPLFWVISTLITFIMLKYFKDKDWID